MDIALCVAGVFILISLAHLYWALGGRAGMIAAVPERPAAAGQEQASPLFKPSRTSTVAVAVVLLAPAFLVLGYAGWISLPLPRPLLQWTVAGAACVMFLRAIGEGHWVGLFKRVRGTRFARLDTWVYSPLCALLGAGMLAVAFS